MENLTGKEALERLGAEKLARGELIRNDDKVEPYINCIKQDLENYEVLKEEHNKVIESTYELSKTFEKINKELEKENVYLKEQNKGLQDIIKIDKQIDTLSFKLLEENSKLKKVIAILEKEPIILTTGFEFWNYDKTQNVYYYEQDEYDYDYDYDGWDWIQKRYFYLKEDFELLKEVLNNETR